MAEEVPGMACMVLTSGAYISDDVLLAEYKIEGHKATKTNHDKKELEKNRPRIKRHASTKMQNQAMKPLHIEGGSV